MSEDSSTMNVLYVLDQFPKLSETFVLNEIVELIKRGVNVEILAHRKPDEVQINEDVLEYKLLEKTQYFSLPHFLKLRYNYCFSPSFYRNTLKTYKQHYSNNTLKQFVRLSYYSPDYSHIDLVHSHFAYEAAMTGLQISQLLEKPFTFTAHAFDIFRDQFYSQERLVKLVDGAQKVITPSVFNKQRIVDETGCDEDKIEIIRATINPDKFTQMNSRSTKNENLKIIAVGRLIEKKGFEYLIRAMSTVAREVPNIELDIIGDGDLDANLRDLTDELELNEQIRFRGALTNEQCIKELKNADISVLPCVVASDGDLDVCPLTLQEAMAMEVPVISTTAGSVPELITHMEEGLLVTPRNEEQLADAIINLAKNPELRKKLGKTGSEKIKREFNIKTQAQKLLTLWENTVNNIN